MKNSLLAVAALCLFWSGLVLADNGKVLASQCFQCHGPNGHSKGEIDSLSGRSASDLYGDLIDMKNKPEIDIMHLQAKIYTDAEIRELSNYLSTLN